MIEMILGFIDMIISQSTGFTFTILEAIKNFLMSL